jgi:hypothetical protein
MRGGGRKEGGRRKEEGGRGGRKEEGEEEGGGRKEEEGAKNLFSWWSGDWDPTKLFRPYPVLHTPIPSFAYQPCCGNVVLFLQ